MIRKSILFLLIFSLFLSAGCIIKGRITDKTGSGMQGVTVTLSGYQSRSTITDSDGYYVFGDLATADIIPVGSYTVAPLKSGYNFTPTSSDVTISAGTLGDLEDIPWPITGVDFSAGEVEKGALFLEVNNPHKTYKGRTLFTDGYNNRIVEVNMLGEIVWEFSVPMAWFSGTPVGFEAELLSDDTILLVISNSGLYRIDRNGNIIFHHDDPDISHDVDLLDTGNYLYVFGNNDLPEDAALKEITPQGEIVWTWYPRDQYLQEYPPAEWSEGGYAHVNGTQRLSDGTTMVSLRNFHTTAILADDGSVVEEYEWFSFGDATYPHDPVIDEEDNTLLVSLQNDSPYASVEIDLNTRQVLWTYPAEGLRTTRDTNRLSNGNYLLTTVDTGGTAFNISNQDDYSTIIEVTPEGEIVWRLTLNAPVGANPGWFFKAQRY